MQKVAVIQRLQAEVIELQIALTLQRRRQTRQIKLQHLFVQQLVLHAFFDKAGEIVDVGFLHIGLGDIASQHLARNRVEQEPRSGVGIGGVFFYQGARRENGCFEHLFHRHTVVQIAHGLCEDRLGLHTGTQTLTRGANACAQLVHVQDLALSAVHHVQDRVLRGHRHGLTRAFLRPLLPVEHIGAGNLMLAATHQAQLNMVLHIFNMEGAAAGARTHQCPGDLVGQCLHRLAHAGGCRALGSMNRKKGLHQRNGDLVGLKRYDCAIAANDLVMRQGTRSQCCSF